VEAHYCEVLDCAVCGQQWMTSYLESLNSEDQTKVTVSEGIKVFKFGGGETLKSLASYKIPAVIADKDVMICTDVVDSDIQLLLSLDSTKKAKIKLDLENDSAEIYGKHTALNHTTSGHYCINIDKSNWSVDTVKLHQLDQSDRRKAQSYIGSLLI